MPSERSKQTSLVFLALHTTGTRTTRDRVIEIAALKVENGRVVDRYARQLNPVAHLPRPVAQATGLAAADLQQAPSLEEILPELAAWLDDATLVAHNARVAHAFLRNACRRAGTQLKLPILCMRRIARLQTRSTSRLPALPILLKQHGIELPPVPRASDHTEALWALWQQWQARHTPAQWHALLGESQRQPGLPAQLDPDDVSGLPAAPGVYLLYGHNRLPLYVGKSINLRRRVLDHFRSDHRNDKEMRLAQQVMKVEWETTAGDLEAQLREAELVKSLMPILNRQLRKQRRLYSWQWPAEAHAPTLVAPDAPDAHQASLYGLFRSTHEARQALKKMATLHGLCPRILGLEQGRGRCFASQLGKCRGACCGQEALATHSRRAREALESLQISAWPWQGPVVVKERHPASQRTAWHLVWQWCYLGRADTRRKAAGLARRTARLDRDSYRILSRFLHHPDEYGLEIFPLNRDMCRP